MLLDRPEVDLLIDLALQEDGVVDDLTAQAALQSPRSLQSVRASIVAKSNTIAAGAPLVPKILARAGALETIHFSCLVAEGTPLKAGSPWIILEGKSIDLLRLERVMLNFLIRMCGIAATTRQVLALIAGTSCKLLHTRKTAPGHRFTDVYATQVAGAHPHRIGLNDAILVKENHHRIAGTVQDLHDGLLSFRNRARFLEIEVTNFVELKYALLAKPDRILLDNFSIEDVAKAVLAYGSAVEFEASGGIGLHNVRAYAETGVDYVSMGFITHSAPAADLSMLFDFPN